MTNLPHVFMARQDDGMEVTFDRYTEEGLAAVIEPALRKVKIRLGRNALVMLENGEEVRLSGGEYAAMALEAASAIIHRNDPDPSST